MTADKEREGERRRVEERERDLWFFCIAEHFSAESEQLQVYLNLSNVDYWRMQTCNFYSCQTQFFFKSLLRKV